MNDTTYTAEEHRAAAAAAATEAAASFERCDTDGFLSQWASGITSDLHRRKAEILENGGMATFPALFDLEGELVPAKLIDGRFGLCWAILKPGTDQFSGVFVSAFPARESTMRRKGYYEGQIEAPAIAVTGGGSGTGLSGCMSVRVVTIRRPGFEDIYTVLDNGADIRPV